MASIFKLKTSFTPRGDQPEAIDRLVKGLNREERSQTLLGITGSGKTFTMANVIVNVQKPTLILAHNKTLAAQLYQEFKSFFPENAVEYFVSYYDYYQPEAYIARTDTYIEKDLAINDRIDRMRLSATKSLIERKDVIIVASVSCIYGLGAPENFASMRLYLERGARVRRDDLLLRLVAMNYERSEFDLVRSKFRVRGDILEIVPSYEEDRALRIEFFGDEIERISVIDPLTARVFDRLENVMLYPGSHYVIPEMVRERAIESIRDELAERLEYYKKEGKLVEEHRLSQRTRYDLEMIKEIGFCKGIENYSRHFSNRAPGAAPSCLLDYFPEDFLIFIDESHQTVPQIRAMFNGDRSRKQALVEFGFRLPSAYDNRPLKFEEFYEKIHQVIYVSATPANFELEESKGEIVRQIIRPTGLLDPEIEVRKAEYQVDDCIAEIQKECSKGHRVLVTTLTKKLSEDLTKYLQGVGVKAKYLHSDIDTLERMQIIRDLRLGLFDVLVGINLLREGLDIPEVSLVAILDADKEGFLRSETALVQTCGRAARNEHGRVILYADKMTDSINKTIKITEERRAIQKAYNETHNIIPKTVHRDKVETLSETFFGKEEEPKTKKKEKSSLTAKEVKEKIDQLEKLMKKAAKEHRFEDAAELRDRLREYQKLELVEDSPI
ncbi:MAG: excinuclease ABC subunit UvrB [Chlamydiae bacterium]|nr:excinuclease ABC subunit UvrB [Chlamydiota bacterium]